MAAFIAAYVTAISRIPDYHHRGKRKLLFSNTEGPEFFPFTVSVFFSDYCFYKRVYAQNEKNETFGILGS